MYEEKNNQLVDQIITVLFAVENSSHSGPTRRHAVCLFPFLKLALHLTFMCLGAYLND